MSNPEAQNRLRQVRAKRRSNHDSTPQSVKERHEAFVREYLVDFNATQAAIRVGYSPHSAFVQGARLLRDANTQRMIAEGKQRKLVENRMTADRTLRNLEILANHDWRKLFHPDGRMKEPWEIDDETAKGIISYKRVNLYEGQGDQRHIYGELRDIKHVDPLAANVKLGEHFGLFPTRPVALEQNNFQMNVYLRSKEELDYFVAHGRWPEDDRADPGRSGQPGEIVRSDSSEKKG